MYASAIPIDAAERYRATPEPEALTRPPAGSSGRPYLSGRRPSEFEHNRRLAAPRQQALQFERMLRTSIAMSVGLRMLQDTILTGALTVETDDETDDVVADALAEQFGVGDWRGQGRCQSSGDTIARLFTFGLYFGSLVAAEEWVETDGRYWLHDLHYRWPGSIDVWYVDASERLIGVGQSSTTMWADRREMWLNEITYAVIWPEVGGHSGQGLARACVGPWQTDDTAAVHCDVALQKYAVRPLFMQLDGEELRKANIVEPAAIKAEADDLDEMQREYRGGERGGGVLPPWAKFVDVNGAISFDPTPFAAVRGFAQREMMENFSAGFMALGRAESGGSYSLAETQQSQSQKAAQNVWQWITDALNRGPVRRFIEANFGHDFPTKARPRLGYSGVDASRFLAHKDAVVAMFERGILTRQPEDERAIRTEVGLPEMSAETEAQGPRPRGLAATARAPRAERQTARKVPADDVAAGMIGGEQ